VCRVHNVIGNIIHFLLFVLFSYICITNLTLKLHENTFGPLLTQNNYRPIQALNGRTIRNNVFDTGNGVSSLVPSIVSVVVSLFAVLFVALHSEL